MTPVCRLIWKIRFAAALLLHGERDVVVAWLWAGEALRRCGLGTRPRTALDIKLGRW